MRNSSKINTLESKFPILAIEQDCLLTKEADISIGFEVQLPELFTISGEDYEILHSLWHKAIKVLPQYTVIHKQDWFIKEQYKTTQTRRTYHMPTLTVLYPIGTGSDQTTRLGKTCFAYPLPWKYSTGKYRH